MDITCRGGHVDVVTLLLDRGAAVDRAAAQNGRTPRTACEQGHLNTAMLLLDRGADIDLADYKGNTPLIVSCFSPWGTDAVKLLCRRGAKQDGTFPFQVACWMGHVDSARLCLGHGAEADRTDDDGWSPLHSACQDGYVDAARLCLEHGASLDRATALGDTAHSVALENDHEAMAAWLFRKGLEAPSFGTAVRVGALKGAVCARLGPARALVSRQGAGVGPPLSRRPSKHTSQARPAAPAGRCLSRSSPASTGGGGLSAKEEAAAAAERASELADDG